MEHKNLYGDMEFVFKKPQNFEGCTLLNGWHGIGECGFISMSHIVDKLKAERIGYIITSNIPQFITIKNGESSSRRRFRTFAIFIPNTQTVTSTLKPFLQV